MTDKDKTATALKGKKGIARIVNAFTYSMDGLRGAWGTEAAFRQLLTIAVIGISLILYMSPPAWKIAIIVFAHLISLAIELLNSAVEAAIDHTSLEIHPLAKRAKDLGSAAQFVCIVNVLAMWLMVVF